MINRRELIGGLLASAGLWPVASGWADAAMSYTPGDPGLSINRSQTILLDALVDCIIPPTDTPGATAAGVPACIRYILRYGEEKHGAEEFLLALETLDSRAFTDLGQTFPAVTQAKKVAFLEALEQQDNDALRAFLAKLKSLTVFAYCTSQLGATQTLRYLPTPGPYQGCIELTDEHRTWAN